MRKYLKILLGIFAAILLHNQVYAGFTDNKTYKIIVTIPESVTLEPSRQSQEESSPKFLNQDLVIEERIRDHQRIVFHSMVVK